MPDLFDTAEGVHQVLKQAEAKLTASRDLVLEMRRLLLKHAPINDVEVIAALAVSYELVGD